MFFFDVKLDFLRKLSYILLLPMADSTYVGYKMNGRHEIPTKITRMILIAKYGTQDNCMHCYNFHF